MDDITLYKRYWIGNLQQLNCPLGININQRELTYTTKVSTFMKCAIEVRTYCQMVTYGAKNGVGKPHGLPTPI